MNRLVSCKNHYGVVESLKSIFKTTKILSYSDLDGFTFNSGDVLLLGGGEDISPSIYGQAPSRYTGASEVLSSRDVFEVRMSERAIAGGIPVIGICRGAQLLCALNGGSLIQHVTGHGVSHDITTKEGTVLRVSSAHHQMMNPLGTKHDLIAWSSEKLSHNYIIENEELIDVEIEPEIIYFPKGKSLAVQWHPEFMNEKEEAVVYLKNLIKELFGD
jgi:putative glutamine amidotransferase